MVGRDEEYENVANGVGIFSSRISLGYILPAYVNALLFNMLCQKEIVRIGDAR